MPDYWKPYVPAEGQNVLFVNKEMKECSYPGCHYVDSDLETITAHYVSAHGKPETGQSKLSGEVLTKEDKIAAVLESLPREDFMCPFCLSHQSSTATRLFNSEGQLLKKVKCIDCHREMFIDTMRWTRDPRRFGREVGRYPGWWKKVEPVEEWMKKLKTCFPRAYVDLFWLGYGDSKPEWRAKQEEQKRVKEAGGDPERMKLMKKVDESRQYLRDIGIEENDMAKYVKSDGTIDFDLLNKEEEQPQKSLENS